MHLYLLQGVGIENCADNNSNDNNCNVIVSASNPQRDMVDCITPASTSGGLEGRTVVSGKVTADVLATDVGCGGDRYNSGCLQQQQWHDHDRIAGDRTGDGQDRLAVDRTGDGSPQDLGQPYLDAAVLQPHTACFDTGNNRQLHGLTVSLAHK